MALSYFNPGKRLSVMVLGVFLLSVFALFQLIIQWPQGNPHTLIKIQIPQGSTVSDVSDILKKQNIISSERMFNMAVWVMGHERNLPAGTYSLNAAQTNKQIIQQLVYGDPNLKRVTIYEGWNIHQIADELERVLGIKADDFKDLCRDKFLLQKWNIAHESFEGFLFPDTYFFIDKEKPETVISTMVKEYQDHMTDSLINRASALRMNETEVVTLASIIEGEALHNEERPIIAGVYHNRLKKHMKLQADPTIQYIIEDGPRRLLNSDLKIDSPYNTYLYAGLPPGPINNPGIQSIMAALYPEENDFLYFVAKGDGYHTFSVTEEDHFNAKLKFQRVRRNTSKKLTDLTEK